jgi:hypothetical protein
MLFIDQYSYLHFASGIIAYFWGIKLKLWVILHILYEIIENLDIMIYMINEYITIWPGEKTGPDPLINRIGDILFGILGWLSSYYLDKLGYKYGWYKAPHLL